MEDKQTNKILSNKYNHDFPAIMSGDRNPTQIGLKPYVTTKISRHMTPSWLTYVARYICQSRRQSITFAEDLDIKPNNL